ncbi:MAG: flagellar assembly protein FliW [bacterium]|nr:flagellar assembly protein FliW [bacterium]
MSVVESLRFGTLDVPEDKTIFMERPILGFEHLKTFCLVELAELSPFLCMQSTEDPAVSFLVVNPLVFYPRYRIEVNPKEIAELRIAKTESIETYVIVTVPEDARQISVNLQGPVLINTENNLAKQLVLVNSQYQVRHQLLEILETPQRKVERGSPVAV